MFGKGLFRSNPYSSTGFSLNGLINGLNRGLNLADQAIPIYQKTKPLFKNANTIFKTMKDFSSKPVFNKDEPKQIKAEKKEQIVPVNNSGPTFFL